MIKKIALGFVVLFFIIAIPVTFFLVKQQQEIRQKAAPATTMSLTPIEKVVSVGETFTLHININTGENSVVAVNVNLTFDPTKLQAQSIVNSAQFPNILSSGDVSQTGKASITVGTTSISKPFKGNGTVGTVRFRVLQPSETPVRVSFSPESFVGSIGEGSRNALIGTTPATIIISSQGSISPTTQIISTITPSPTIKTSPAKTTSPSSTVSNKTLTLSSHKNGSSTKEDPPKLLGKADPNSTITISFYPGSVAAAVTADTRGNWSFTPSQKVGPGTYTITITSTNSTTGVSQTIKSILTIISSSTITASPTLTDGNPSPSPAENPIPITGSFEFTSILVLIGIVFIVIGIALALSLK